MINPDSPTTEVLPGFTRADLDYLAECLEGRHGEGRRAEAAPRSAEFIRVALALVRTMNARVGGIDQGRARLLAGQYNSLGRIGGFAEERAPTDNDLEAAMTPLTAQGDGGEVLILSDSERRMIEKQRAHEARNRGDDDGNGGLPPA